MRHYGILAKPVTIRTRPPTWRERLKAFIDAVKFRASVLLRQHFR